MVYVWMNDAVNDRASCLSLSMSACRHRWIFLRVSFVRWACADEWIDIAWWSPSPGIVWHCEVRNGLLVMKMSSMLFCLVGVVIICSVWVVRSMSKKCWLLSAGYECPCMVQSGQLMSGRLRSPPTQSTSFCVWIRGLQLHYTSFMYCWSLFGGRYIAAIMTCLLLLRCNLVAVISSCAGVVIGS